MNTKYIFAAALALSLSMASANVQAAEVSADLGAHVRQVIAEIHIGDTDWQRMVGRIDRLVAHIDQQIAEGTGDYDELRASRRRLVNARAEIQRQHLTAAEFGGEVAVGPAPAAACEVCGVVHSAPVAAPAPLDGTAGVVDGGFSTGGGSYSSGGYSSGGTVGGGGGGAGGFGGIGALGGIAAAIAIAINNDNDSGLILPPGPPASPSNP